MNDLSNGGDLPIIIIGAGPAGLMAAQTLAERGHKVEIYEQNKAAGRKFLVAGHGGFNLTHSEALETFVQKYDAPQIRKIVSSFDNQKVVDWLSDLGISTYTGSSGKVFPTKNFKPIQVFRAWLDRLDQLGVIIHYEHTFVDFDEKTVTLKNKDSEIKIDYPKLILSMGGGSWKKTGSDAKWLEVLKSKNIDINPLQAANSGYNTDPKFHQLEGQYMKNIKVTFDGNEKTGEIVFTKYGIEGSPIYYLNRFMRPHPFPKTIYIDLKPKLTEVEIRELIMGKKNIAQVLKRQLKLSTTALNLLKILDKESYTHIGTLSKTIKHFPIEVLGFRPIDEVISTSGGVSFSALTDSLALRDYPNVYCAGEMTDWEAPTGGYLLQACFSSGHWIADEISNSTN